MPLKAHFRLLSNKKTIIASDISKQNKKLIAVNLRNELAGIKQLYDLAPNDLLLSQISDVESRLNKLL